MNDVNDKQITIQLKNIYGRTLAYPACVDSSLFACIAGTKTLTRACLKDIESLGYRIEDDNARGALADYSEVE